MGEFAKQCKKPLNVDGKNYYYYELAALHDARIERLPFSIRVLLESAVRNCDELSVTRADVETILDWQRTQSETKEIAFKPARVILQDFTGVPAVVDLAAMRDAVAKLGGDPEVVNPIIPCDLVIDHSVQVDFARTPDALKKNEEMEFMRNRERYEFLKWGMHAFRNFLIVPPASGIVHQVNLEYLARVVFKSDDSTLYPDSVLGTDSHTTMINGLSVLGWGVGGIEAEAALLGQSVSMVLPEVIGFRLTGALDKLVTSTDMVLTVTKQLRALGVVGKFVEFFGPGCAHLSIADRATISNMSPEMGSTCCFFAPDHKTIQYLRQTGRPDEQIAYIEAYYKAQKFFRDYSDNADMDPENSNISYTQVVELDLSTVVPCLSGPKRPHDQVTLRNMQRDYRECLTHKIGFKGYGISEDEVKKQVPFTLDEVSSNDSISLKHGDVVIAAITSCTNTSNPSVMLGAGMLAQNAVKKGLTVKKHIKTSLAPGSAVVTRYLEAAGVMPALRELGFDLVGYGCTTCIGNSGPLHPNIEQAIESGDLVVASVLSGNRNFEGRVHPYTRANYLASPMLVVAYALAGTVDFDFDTMPLGTSSDGKNVFLRDIWPVREEIDDVEKKNVLPEMFKTNYSTITNGSDQWNAIKVSHSTRYPWNPESTYIKNPPYFDNLSRELKPIEPIRGMRVLLNLGDSITTDHISPAGAISRTSPAAQYLQERGVTDPKEYNSYGARRGNDAVMVRGTFANTRLVNKFVSKAGPRTIHFPTMEEINIFDAAERYKFDGTPLMILAGQEYGSGSSRDWAAKGPLLMGVRAVLAESFERIHRSNLVGMGIVPLQYMPGDTAEILQLSGKETFSLELPSDLGTDEEVQVTLDDGRTFKVVARFDTVVELEYFRHGGIMQYMIRKLAGACK